MRNTNGEIHASTRQATAKARYKQLCAIGKTGCIRRWLKLKGLASASGEYNGANKGEIVGVNWLGDAEHIIRFGNGQKR